MSGAATFELSLPPPARRTILETLQDLQVAAAAETGVGPAQMGRAERLFALGRDDELIAELSGRAAVAALEPDAALLLAEALGERGRGGDLVRACELAVRVGAQAVRPGPRAAANAVLAKLLLNAGQPVQARRAAAAALADDADHGFGWMRLIRASLASGDAAGLLQAARGRLDAGPAVCGALAAQDLAWAVLEGRPVSALAGLEGGRLEPPPGWESREAFNAALAAELLAHPALTPSRTGGEGGYRLRVHDPLLEGGSPAFQALLGVLNRAILDRVARTRATDPWSRVRPDAASLRVWAVVTHGPGHDRWHMHAQGWLSGVYYVATPDVAGGEIEFGCPEQADADPPLRGPTLRRRPAAGDWVSFPSHLHHRTWPTGAAARRISVAFDVVPRGA